MEGFLQLGVSQGVGDSPFYLTIPKEKLSIPYQMQTLLNVTVLGNLIDVKVLEEGRDSRGYKGNIADCWERTAVSSLHLICGEL
ncbi:MAG: hypothetical protein FJ358_02510 [Thaumarchaeota archaeon]|nr:hypothetical protein [Nitrososphaerota archaeon]